MAEPRQEEPLPAPQRPRTPRQLESFIEQRIREAADRGDLDNLETRGRPLSLDLKDAIDREAWFVNRTMKSLGAVPAWMELGKEIDAAEAKLRWMRLDFERWLGETREQLMAADAVAREAARPNVELRYEDRFARYSRQAEELRTLVDRFNLEVPVRALEKPGVWVAHELNRLQRPFESLCETMSWEAAAVETSSPPASPDPTLSPAFEQRDGVEGGRKRRLLELWRRSGKEKRMG